MRRTSAASRPRCCGPSAREAGDVAVFSRLGALPRIPSRPLSGDEVCSWGSVLRCWGSPYRRTNRKERRIWVTLPSGSRWEDTPCPALSPRETKWIARSCWAALSCTRACHKTRLPGCLRIRRRYDDSKAYEAFLKGLKEWERAPPSWAASPPRAPRDTKPVLANSFFYRLSVSRSLLPSTTIFFSSWQQRRDVARQLSIWCCLDFVTYFEFLAIGVWI